MRYTNTTLLGTLTFNTSQIDDSPQFLGKHRNGISPETQLIDSFPETGPELIWRTPLGVRMSGMTVSYGLVYTMFQDNDNQYAAALDEKSGKEV